MLYEKGTVTGLVTLALCLLPNMGQAVLSFDQNVTPDVIFGSGNTNGGFTVDRANNIEVGLRTKLRFDAANLPQNQFNSNGDGTYTFEAGQPLGGGFGFAPGSSSTATWNFEWSINVDENGTSGNSVQDYWYLMQIDFDPSAGVNFLSFDPIHLPLADHALGTNATGNGGGTVATDAFSYTILTASNNVAQNSWNYEFFDDVLTYPFDANVAGIYTIALSVLAPETSDVLAKTEIDVIVTPEPSTYLLLGSTLCVVGYVRRRKRLCA